MCVCACIRAYAVASSICSPAPSSLQQSEIYQGIDPAEFVNYLYKLQDSIGTERIDKFQQVCVRACVCACVRACMCTSGPAYFVQPVADSGSHFHLSGYPVCRLVCY